MPRAKRAIDNPTSTGAGDLNPEHFPAPQRESIDMSAALAGQAREPIAIETEAVASARTEAAAKNAYLDDLKFNEDPVTVIIPRGGERNSPLYVPCHVNGVGAEVHLNGKWVRFGWLPVNTQLVVKRKYLEVLARSRKDSVSTREVTSTPLPNQDGFKLEFESHQVAPFSVRHDPAGERGMRWYDRVLTEA